ncbi:MAG: heavy metal-associated domain-containing protein [Flavobacteriaceae bacterium]|nr:heavy metal-associated domain-containing protein [Flavobacteriaceae bacterium]
MNHFYPNNLIFWCFFVCGMIACKNSNNPPTVIVETENVNTSSVEVQADTMSLLTIEGMVCAIGCAKVIEDNLNQVQGVLKASVDFDAKIATIRFDSQLVQPDTFLQTIEDISDRFKVKELEVSK